MDARWFKEDRKVVGREEQRAAIEASKKALRNSTLLSRRLTEILEEEVQKTYTKEEHYQEANWERVVFGLFQRRKVLNEIIKLLPTKEVTTK